MTARLTAPRALCPACRRKVALRQDGTCRPHWDQDPDTGLRYIDNRCSGVGQQPATEDVQR